MKKILLTILPLLITIYSHAQNTFPWPSVGNIGIGTNAPLAPLDIKMTTNQHVQFVPDLNGNTSGFSGIVCINDANSAYTPLGFWASKYFLGGGNVGIGTSQPSAKLDVQGGNFAVYSGAASFVSIGSGATGKTLLQLGTSADAGGYSTVQAIASSGSAWGNLNLNSNGGNVGIGTTQPDQKLTVAGTVHATEVLVDQTVPTPDYVFDKDYDLASLKDVKTYIDENHHLPEIPSAAQVAKEGINLGEMNAKLLKKIEELTLYLIAQQQQLQNQNQINTSLKNDVELLKNKLETLTKDK